MYTSEQLMILPYHAWCIASGYNLHFSTHDFTKYEHVFSMIQYDFPFVASMAYPGNSTCEIGMNETESWFDITLISLRIIYR